jgi:hypothetical protein
LMFDESLPKHQDWDFVLSCLLKGYKVKKMESCYSYFDRSDKGSLSRVYKGEKSEPWYLKLKESNGFNKVKLKFIEFHLFGKFLTHYSWPKFIFDSVRFLFTKKIRFDQFLKAYVHRFLQLIKYVQ